MSEVKPTLDECDGDQYIDTIEWFLPKVCVFSSSFLDRFTNTQQDHAIVEGKEIEKERVQYFRLNQRLLVEDYIVWHEDIDTTEGLTLWSNRPEDLTSKALRASFSCSNPC
jgi:hypothetical protein